jgi:tRNA (guanine37-N1)-methyltransferase
VETRIHLAIVHHPVYDRQGKEVATSLTTIDLHDLARVTRTYGLAALWVVTPLASQKTLARRMMAHWITGPGASLNPTRGEALSTVRVVDSIAEAIAGISEASGGAPGLLATSAREGGAETVSAAAAVARMRSDGRHWLVLLGTGWGLTRAVLESADMLLAPIRAASDFNHLPVRCAGAILVDRLLGDGEGKKPLP